MLILPLHRPFDRANFPFVTMALVLVNVVVFLFLQSGDGAAAARAAAYYGESGLGRIELPLYREWLQAHPHEQREALLQHVDESSVLTAQVLQSDGAFVQALNADTLITQQDPRHAAWKEQRAEFERLWQRQFTERHLLRYSEIDPGRVLSSMFLHGGFGHLLGLARPLMRRHGSHAASLSTDYPFPELDKPYGCQMLLLMPEAGLRETKLPVIHIAGGLHVQWRRRGLLLDSHAGYRKLVDHTLPARGLCRTDGPIIRLFHNDPALVPRGNRKWSLFIPVVPLDS